MAIIKLTGQEIDVTEEKERCHDLDVFVVTSNILHFRKAEEGSYINLLVGELQVKETPEEILALIKEEEK